MIEDLRKRANRLETIDFKTTVIVLFLLTFIQLVSELQSLTDTIRAKRF